MPEIHAALSFNLDANLIQTALPLFEEEAVEGLEWSFDALYKHSELPEWLEELLQQYGTAGRLVGHGVYFSLFSGKWLPAQAEWLETLRGLSKRFQFDHVSEHFGFLTGADFHKGAPLSVPSTARTLAIGQDRLLRIADACGCPVGLENLAFATDRHSARVHGEFLERLIAPVNGFVILDLHNMYCQSCNFDLAAEELLAGFPLHRVREIHLSGGSWEPSAYHPQPGVRRDTHDDRVPEEVFQLLEDILPRCPNTKFVVLEQLGSALVDEQQQAGFQADFLRMREIVHREGVRRGVAGIAPSSFLPPRIVLPVNPVEDAVLYEQQGILSDILESSDSLAAAQAGLRQSILADSDWGVEGWDPAMLETARLIARKWKDGF